MKLLRAIVGRLTRPDIVIRDGRAIIHRAPKGLTLNVVSRGGCAESDDMAKALNRNIESLSEALAPRARSGADREK